MKIMILNSLYYPYKFGGAEVSVQLLAEELVKKNHEVRVVTLNDQGSIKKEVINGVKVISLPLKNRYWPFSSEAHSRIQKLFWHLKDVYNADMVSMVHNEITNFSPDIIHTNNLAGFSIGVWDVVKRDNYKLVHTARDYYLFHPNSTLFKNGVNIDPDSKIVKLLSFYKKNKSQKIDAFVGISQHISLMHKNNGFAKKALFAHIYNPVDKPDKVKREKTKIITVGFIGRFTTEKGFDIFCEYAKKYQDCMKFIAAGKASSSNESNLLITDAKLSGVEIQGYVPVEDFLNEVDAILLPTKWHEPFGRVVAEAALSRTPIFTNLTGGVKEIAEMFPWVLSVDEFSPKKIKTILGYLNTEKEVENPFNKEEHAGYYIDIYNKLLDVENKKHDGV